MNPKAESMKCLVSVCGICMGKQINGAAAVNYTSCWDENPLAPTFQNKMGKGYTNRFDNGYLFLKVHLLID